MHDMIAPSNRTRFFGATAHGLPVRARLGPPEFSAVSSVNVADLKTKNEKKGKFVCGTLPKSGFVPSTLHSLKLCTAHSIH